MKEITISELARCTGLASSAIRYYEQEGLIHSIGRKGLQRVFNVNVIERLQLITWAKEAHFSIRSLRLILENSLHFADKQRLIDQANALQCEILRLQGIQDGLRHVALCEFEDVLACPKFRKIISNKILEEEYPID